jgi:hypothetical protein
LVKAVAVEALPVNAPTNVVEVTLDSPAIVVAEPPNDIDVEPTVTDEFAKLAFVIPAVPDKFPLVNPDIDPPNVIVPVEVIVPPVNVIPETVPVVATEVTPLFITFKAVVAYEAVVAVEALPVNAPTNVVEVTELNPAIVVAEDPKDIAVEPTVTLLFVN